MAVLHGYGRVQSPFDQKDHRLSLYAATPPVLPRALSPTYYVATLDQGRTPRCVGFSGALGRALDEHAEEHESLRFDPNDLYEHCKAIDGDPNGDGTYIRIACKVLQSVGGLVTVSHRADIHVGDRLKIANYARLVSDLDVKSAIFLYGSAWIGSNWPYSWESPTRLPSGRFVMPKPDASAGGHAYEYIGWDDDMLDLEGIPGCWEMQNSWGRWARAGRAWVPYRYAQFTPASTSAWEAWRTIDVIGDL